MNFNFKKKFGQNFLNDNNVIDSIAQSIKPGVNDLIIEIGPGAGALTKRLKGYNANLIAYEIDTELEDTLNKLVNDKTKIIFDDFMNRDIKEDIKDYNYDKLYVIGNLPYYITTPIVMKIIESNLDIEEFVIMIQKEVADRFSAKPKSKDYGSISVFLNYFFDIKYLFTVNRNKFTPAPNVDSAVIKFTKKSNLLDVDFDKFNKLVKNSFQFKRKNLRNNLRGYDLDKINSILNEHGFSLDNRAEDLSYEIFVDIANKY